MRMGTNTNLVHLVHLFHHHTSSTTTLFSTTLSTTLFTTCLSTTIFTILASTIAFSWGEGFSRHQSLKDTTLLRSINILDFRLLTAFNSNFKIQIQKYPLYKFDRFQFQIKIQKDPFYKFDSFVQQLHPVSANSNFADGNVARNGKSHEMQSKLVSNAMENCLKCNAKLLEMQWEIAWNAMGNCPKFQN